VQFLEPISSLKKDSEASNRRNRIDMMAKILTETKTGLNKTWIMYKCNLSYKQLQTYIKILLEKKLLVRKKDEKGREKFVTTTKGNNFLKNFHALQTQITEKTVQHFIQL
jgi:predicted transcriptional regulator